MRTGNLKINLLVLDDDPVYRSLLRYVLKERLNVFAVETPDTSVLIIGESGTGKELVARAIHTLSSRNEVLFCAVNMSAVPESLFESDFFGHKKGRVGTQNEQQFDVRIIAATNKTNAEMYSGKSLRIDLYHRLSTFIIELPPLRERIEDIPVLVDYFFYSLSKKLGKHLSGIHKDVYDLLKYYPFPGNIRELKNIIERALIICDSDQITPQHFSSIYQLPSSVNDEQSLNTYDLLALEKLTILKALKKVNYNKAEAARLLNLEWNALHRRILKHNIEWPSDSGYSNLQKRRVHIHYRRYSREIDTCTDFVKYR